ncbi:MlaD family protein [Hoyosella subflava]|uniref:Putative Mce family protein n=1 Tax=Hoyosella subflava (strain DSM 45089 / JCM 17490 / NBRC 109087 / DQS3-9A1) TaxID=443218 RepID=F6ERP2_HOYSD|nr:MlaD family protein [Hoyosella subflava]AEF39619.1 Putative Mce family protein [Hoyosella subflava DQS3-9A1]
MRAFVRLAWKPVVFASVMAILLVFIAQAIVRPVSGETHAYTAVFTDANGLRPGDDVRMYGVQVGKVREIRLEGYHASVGFTLQQDRLLYDTSNLAIRYQNLTGQRYIDIQQPSKPGTQTSPGTSIPPTRTTPSFDITALFNGLEPVLAEFSPNAFNHFAENLLAVIEGNDSGIGPALEAIETLSAYAVDRQTVISVLVSNLKHISDQIDGRSPQLLVLIDGIRDVFITLQENFDGVVDFAMTAPPVLAPLNSLLATLGLTPGANPDLDAVIPLLFPEPGSAVEVLDRVPTLVQSINALLPDPGTGVELTCSAGSASAPDPLHVLISGHRISICRN